MFDFFQGTYILFSITYRKTDDFELEKTYFV